ncbi:MAG: hypothetical protein LBD03_01155 [Methanobrevibacter sp.]|jgi:hypothetical protein|nr:hypothetical protein [Candidatus Methanovirga procula]
MNDLDLSESSITEDAMSRGWLSYNGAGHDIFYKLRNEYTPDLDITEQNLSDLRWCGLAKLIASKDSAVILHGMYKSTWGHYFREGAVDFDNGSVYDLGSLSDGLVWRGMYEVESWCAQISQPSCIIFKRK